MRQHGSLSRTDIRTLTCPYPTPLSPSPCPSRLASPHPTSRFVLTPTILAAPTDLPSSTILAALASVDGAQDVWRSIPVTSLLRCLQLQTRPTRSVYTGPAWLFFVVGGCPQNLVAVARLAGRLAVLPNLMQVLSCRSVAILERMILHQVPFVMVSMTVGAPG